MKKDELTFLMANSNAKLIEDIVSAANENMTQTEVNDVKRLILSVVYRKPYDQVTPEEISGMMVKKRGRMTREEAKRQLEVAFEALDQAPKTEINDVKMYGGYSDADLNDWERLPLNMQVLTSSAFGAWLMRRDERIKESKTGHWIVEPNCWLRCSVCGEHYPNTSIYETKGSNYCPNCGARLVEVSRG